MYQPIFNKRQTYIDKPILNPSKLSNKHNYISLEKQTKYTLPCEMYQFAKKENRPPKTKFLQLQQPTSKSRSGNREDSKTSAMSKQDIINRLKKLNQNQNDKNLINSKYLTDNGTHQRYRSSVTRNTSLTFHQLLNEYTSCSSRLKSKNVNTNTSNQAILTKYNNQATIKEEPEIQQKPYISRNFQKEKRVEMDHLLQDLQNKTKVIQQKSYFEDQSRSRIKESVFCKQFFFFFIIELSSKERFYTLKPQKQDTDKINMADKQFMGADAFETLKKSLENMCTLSQQQLTLLNETKSELDPTKKDDSKVVNDSIIQLNLTCEEEEVKVNDDNNNQPQEIVEEDEDQIAEGIIYLIERERIYLPDPHYLENCQKDITWNMRAILIDWMMEVSSEFHLKRETFYLSIYYVDRYLSKIYVHKSSLQLLGLTCLLMASKIEEVYPRKVSDFSRAADHGYTIEQILEMELIILKVTKWQINPPTLNMWVNWYMSQWDIFVKQKKTDWGRFKDSSEESYQCKNVSQINIFEVYKMLTQLIDCCIMDIETLQYQPRTIVASFMYLVVSFKSQIFSLDSIKQMKNSSLFLLDQSNPFNLIFAEFTSLTFGFNLVDLLPIIQYASTFIELPINFDSPPGVTTLPNTPLESNYEEFLSFQSHSQDNLAFVKHRPRDEIY